MTKPNADIEFEESEAVPEIMGNELLRRTQVAQVLGLMEAGETENKACQRIGINRGTFRSAALRAQAADSYARALTALAYDQVEKLEVAIDDMRQGKIDSAQARVEIDARKWFASKFLPKRFGDRTILAGDEEAPIGIQAVTDRDRAKAMAALVARGIAVDG